MRQLWPSGQLAGDEDVAEVELGVEVGDAEAEQVVEGFDEIDGAGLAGPGGIGGNAESVVERFLKILDRQQGRPGSRR
jgi:hypothetical protein